MVLIYNIQLQLVQSPMNLRIKRNGIYYKITLLADTLIFRFIKSINNRPSKEKHIAVSNGRRNPRDYISW
jgi:hypothetical protein